MKPSLRYKALTGLLRATRFRFRMLRDAPAGRTRCTVPRGRDAKRWVRGEFDGRAVWTCHPVSGPTGQVYVHMHGGGYVYGLLPTHYSALREVCDHADVSVILPDYPLPPNARAPQIIDWADRSVASAVDRYGLGNVTLGGCSAGGNLALAVLQSRAARGEANPAHTVLWSPWLDLTPFDTPPTKADDYEALISPFALEPAVAAYIGDSGMDRTDPLISPANMSLGGVGTLHIVTGERDVLFPAIDVFAERARAAGVLGHYQREPELGHYWMFYPVPDRHPTLRQIAGWLREFVPEN